MLVLNLRSVDLLLLMVTGSPSLLQLRYVVLHFQPLSDGDYMELVVLSFYSLLRLLNPFMLVYSLVAILGATVDLGMLWSIAETFNGLMAIPNLIALFLLSGTVVKLVKDYFHEK